jgi:hypothetical protein
VEGKLTLSHDDLPTFVKCRVARGPTNCTLTDEGEAEGRASEHGKEGNAGLIPAPVPGLAWGRPRDTQRKRGLDRIAILIRLLTRGQNMKVKVRDPDARGVSWHIEGSALFLRIAKLLSSQT